MNWYPDKRLGLLLGLALLAALVLADGSLLDGIAHSPVNLSTFLRVLLVAATLPLFALVAYALLGLANLAYRVERNGIVIRWALGHDVIPMGEIRRIGPFPAGRRVVGGIGWPGYHIGQAKVEGLGLVRLYTTRRPGRSLLIRTAEQCYVISPANVEGFLADYQVRRLLGPLAEWLQGQRVPRLFVLDIWGDRLAGLLFLCGLLINLGLCGYLAARYPGLPPRMVLSFDPTGLGDRIGASADLFLLPGVGLGILLVNGLLAAWVHGRERVLALLLLSNVPFVQALAWLAVSRLIA